MDFRSSGLLAAEWLVLTMLASSGLRRRFVQLSVSFGWSDLVILVIGHQPFNQLPSHTFGTLVPVAFQCSDIWLGADGISKVPAE